MRRLAEKHWSAVSPAVTPENRFPVPRKLERSLVVGLGGSRHRHDQLVAGCLQFGDGGLREGP